MERNTKDPQVVCAVNILLENKRKAKQMLGEMEENERDEFVRYPIYGLMQETMEGRMKNGYKINFKFRIFLSLHE